MRPSATTAEAPPPIGRAADGVYASPPVSGKWSLRAMILSAPADVATLTMSRSTAPSAGHAYDVSGLVCRIVCTVRLAASVASFRWLREPVTFVPVCASDARSGSANGSVTTFWFCTAVSRSLSHCLASAWFLPDLSFPPGPLTLYGSVMASTEASRSGSITQVTSSSLPRASICWRRPPGPICFARSLSSKTGVCCSFAPVSAVRWESEISGHRAVVFVLVSALLGCQGRKVRWMPSVCWYGCAVVCPMRATLSW